MARLGPNNRGRSLHDRFRTAPERAFPSYVKEFS